jgi:hypothetical protein
MLLSFHLKGKIMKQKLKAFTIESYLKTFRLEIAEKYGSDKNQALTDYRRHYERYKESMLNVAYFNPSLRTYKEWIKDQQNECEALRLIVKELENEALPSIYK